MKQRLTRRGTQTQIHKSRDTETHIQTHKHTNTQTQTQIRRHTQSHQQGHAHKHTDTDHRHKHTRVSYIGGGGVGGWVVISLLDFKPNLFHIQQHHSYNLSWAQKPPDTILFYNWSRSHSSS